MLYAEALLAVDPLPSRPGLIPPAALEACPEGCRYTRPDGAQFLIIRHHSKGSRTFWEVLCLTDHPVFPNPREYDTLWRVRASLNRI